MGLCGSRVAPGLTKAEKEEVLLKHAELRKSLAISEADFLEFYNHFLKASTQPTPVISYKDFLNYFDIDRDKFTRRLFGVLCFGSSRGLNFPLFLYGMWSFCGSDADALTKFAFNMYDTRGKGLLESKEVHAMLAELFGDDYMTNSLAKKIMKEIMEKDIRGRPVAARIDYRKFEAISKTAKNLLYMPFNMQTVFQKKLFGPAWWEARSAERAKLSREGVIDLEAVASDLQKRFPAPTGKAYIVVDGTVIMDSADPKDRPEARGGPARVMHRTRSLDMSHGRPRPNEGGGFLNPDDDEGAGVTPPSAPPGGSIYRHAKTTSFKGKRAGAAAGGGAGAGAPATKTLGRRASGYGSRLQRSRAKKE